MEHVIGFDGGGTKTEVVLADRSGIARITLDGSSTNVKAIGLSRSLEVIDLLLDEVYANHPVQPENCRSVCLGLAGTERPEERSVIEEHLRQYFRVRSNPDISVRVTNDAEIALAAAFEENRGVIAISGTGAIVFGIASSGEHYRAGGWGHLLGDKGSGYEIGLAALQTVMLGYDGVLPRTLLTDLVLEKLGVPSPPELRNYIYKPHIEKKHIAEVAEACLQAAAKDDGVAAELLARAAGDLAALTAALRRKDASFSGLPQGITGSIFKHSPLFRKCYSERLEQLVGPVTVVPADQRPVFGAVKLALRSEEGLF